MYKRFLKVQIVLWDVWILLLAYVGLLFGAHGLAVF